MTTVCCERRDVQVSVGNVYNQTTKFRKSSRFGRRPQTERPSPICDVRFELYGYDCSEILYDIQVSNFESNTT